jgi:hypothetical protein
MKARSLAVMLAAAVLTAAAYWYWSPALAFAQMQSAARAGDAEAFNRHVDYLRLRDNLKAQLSVALNEKLAPQRGSQDSFTQAGSALAATLGFALIDEMVDAFVRPEVVMLAMKGARLMPTTKAPESVSSGSGLSPGNGLQWQSERKGVDKYVAHVSKVGAPEDQQVSFVLERSGFAIWRLTELWIPTTR